MKRFADIYIIGQPRAGTTWLHALLEQNSVIKELPLKEVHYFDRNGFWSERRQFSKFLKRAWRLLFFGKNIPIRKRLYLIVRSMDEGWYNTYLTACDSTRLSCDASPSYCCLPNDIIYDIITNAKCIYIERNPIERQWSAYCYFNKNVALNESEIFYYNIFSKGQRTNRVYLDESLKVQQNLLVLRYEDIIKHPEKLAFKLFDFLGIQRNTIIIPEKKNKSRSYQMPRNAQSALEKIYG